MRSPAIIFVALAVLIVAWLYSRQNAAVPLVVSGLIEADEVRVGSRVGGRVAGVTATEGQRVRVKVINIDNGKIRLSRKEAV